MAEPLIRKAGILEDETDLEMITLDMICMSLFGPEYIVWESETLKDELSSQFGNIGVVCWQKIQAVRLLHANDSAWKEWEVFEKVCAAAIGELPIFSHAQPPEPEDIAILLNIMEQIDSHDLHEDVRGYIAAACLNDGLFCLEGELSVAEKAIDWYIKNKGIDIDYARIKSAAARKTLYSDASTMAEVQANRMILVRKNVDKYNSKLQKELSEYSDIIGVL